MNNHKDDRMIDFNYGISRFVDEKMFMQFLKRFEAKDLNNSLNDIQSAYNSQNWPELKRSSHSLKGSSGYVGALICQKLSENLQNLCAENPPKNLEEVDQALKKLIAHINELQSYLTNYFKKPSEPAKPEKNISDKGNEDNKPSPKIITTFHNDNKNSKGEEEKQASVEESHKAEEEPQKELDSPVFVVKRMVPPSCKINENDKNTLEAENEIDLYDEINKQWRCEII
ncbi:unnamed protein product [Blepharisma stoltei]|uniref:HPt domain-containing protein n=1 Tax=Blepharisma stoltei TaxID=1481888 RepID=A0AAU9JYS1_9CILI|nr:unnamed protein product [Blepharisma stoltei]